MTEERKEYHTKGIGSNVAQIHSGAQERLNCYRIAAHSQMMFHICYLNGTSETIPYSEVKKVFTDPSVGLIIRFHDKTELAVKGRNLVPLRDRMGSHRVTHIEEKCKEHDVFPENEDFIDSIEWIKTEED